VDCKPGTGIAEIPTTMTMRLERMLVTFILYYEVFNLGLKWLMLEVFKEYLN
jgi:hypothetical protein